MNNIVKFIKYLPSISLRRQYPPITLLQLQKFIDTDRIDVNQPIDLTSFCNTGLYAIRPDSHEFGVQLLDDGAQNFKAKINIEVQYASELAISIIERNGGVITTAYYDQHSLWAVNNPKKWFEKGVPIPKRMLPPQDAIDYYTDPKNRGYLADLKQVSKERLVLAQKYGYELPKIENDVNYTMLSQRKDPRQIFYGLHPGWVISVADQTIIKPKEVVV